MLNQMKARFSPSFYCWFFNFIMKFLTRLFNRNVQPEVPEYNLGPGQLVYAVGDIHGRFDLLQQLVEKMEDDRSVRWGVERCQVIFLGDYVDRGFQSKEVLDFLMEWQPGWADVVCLRGNHEEMMLQFAHDPVGLESWLEFGGVATLASYGVALAYDDSGRPDLQSASRDLADALKGRHSDFLEGLKFTHQEGGYLFVHAGIRPGVDLNEQEDRDYTWIRTEFTSSNQDHGVRVVHGHTGVQNPLDLPNRIAVDTTAYATGRLTAAAIQGQQVVFLSTR
jgi:serine/threonine protein phosphatase 1